MEIITIVAIYGAILSTILAGWTIYIGWRDRANVEVKVNVGIISRWIGNAEKILSIDITNKGRRPVTISSVGIFLENNQVWTFTQNTGLPKKLTEGTAHTVTYNLDQAIEMLKQEKPKYAFARDQTGKEYKSKTDIKKLLRNL